MQHFTTKNTVESILKTYKISAISRLKPYFVQKELVYPPQKVTFLAIKDEAKLELWVQQNNKNELVRIYPIKALSGQSGPKLHEGDGQVPEGFYRILWLNPNSSYHLSMKINYPNRFDLKQAEKEHRNEPGSDIFIHGKAVSIGCLAMGDETIEELFTLAAIIGVKNISVIITPSDPRKHPLIYNPKIQSPWVKGLYDDLEEKIKQQFNP